MKQFASLVVLVSTSVMTTGCVSESQVLTIKNPFASAGDPHQAQGDPFQAAAMSRQGAGPGPQARSAPGYAAVGASPSASPGMSQTGWSTTRRVSATAADSPMPSQPWQTAAVPEDDARLTFRAATSLPESQTEVVNSASAPVPETSIPAIGSSSSRATVADDPFEQGSVTNADFVETGQSPITQLAAEQPSRASQASPATLEMPVFAEETAEENDPFGQAASRPADEPEWWDQ